MSQICVISGIHSNIHALKFLLEYINKHYDVKYILNLGDFLQYGPNPCEVFDLVINDKRFINIIGNKELELINNNFGDGLTFDGEEMHEAWTLNKLGTERISVLKKLPLSKSIEICGKKIFMLHLNCKFDIFSTQTNLVKIITDNSLETFSEQDKVLIINEHDFLLMDDDHSQSFDTSNSCTVIKPGAVSSLNDKNISFSIININEKDNDVIFKKISHDSYYDTINECIRNKVPDPSFGIYRNKIKKDLYTVRLSPKYDTNIILPDWSFWPQIINTLMNTIEFVEISCWNTERNIINEIISNFDIIDRKVKGEKNKDKYQIFFKIKLNNITKNTIMNEFLYNNQIKWFSIYLYNKNNNSEPCFICEHYGHEIFLYKMSEKQIKNLRNILNNKRLNINYF